MIIEWVGGVLSGTGCGPGNSNYGQQLPINQLGKAVKQTRIKLGKPQNMGLEATDVNDHHQDTNQLTLFMSGAARQNVEGEKNLNNEMRLVTENMPLPQLRTSSVLKSTS